MIDTTFSNYIQSISEKFSYAETSEMGYRTHFETLLKDIFESINVKHFDHDAKASKGNKPDFVVKKNGIPILYIETKDIGISLDKVEKSEQMSRYFGYANLVLTDYVEFRFYRNGDPYGEPIKIAEYDKKNRTITSIEKNFDYLAKTFVDFTQSHKEPIKSGKHLSKIMGGKAQRIRDNIKEIFSKDSNENSELMNVFEMIKKLLVQDLTTDSFADMYAQTLVYGLFIARFYDESLESFTRQEARDLIPASNPFLGHFFDHIAGRNFEPRLSYIVDELCEVFTHANVTELMEQHFKTDSKKGIERGQDQVIHFYEDFLKEYDDVLRKKMGAYYTPLPVVQFIVRSVDYLLEKEFNLPGGLSNTSKMENGLHKVQILDPAVGTGTFISDIIGKIYSRIKRDGQVGRWPTYVHHDLLPRLFGFELMMAPYTIAHLKLSMALKDTGFKYFNETRAGKARLGIYLTNSLEEIGEQPELFAFDFGASIAEEAKQASEIKNKKPVMVVVGNPPYSISSANKGKWIQNLIKDYKKDLNEQKINLDDDYIKFIRFAEHFIERNGCGIVAMITNNSFLDGVTHRQMRKHLLETFNDIYILDLHGNSKKKEKAPNGGSDENVFDIQQGVSISIFVRKEAKEKDLGRVHHAELYGKRPMKFEGLNKNSIKNIDWKILNYSDPYYFFVPKDFNHEKEYNEGFKVDELFSVYNSGIQTKNDGLAVQIDRHLFEKVVNDFRTLSISELRTNYSRKESSGWSFEKAKKDLSQDFKIVRYQYRPFDYRWLCYTSRSGGFIGRSRSLVMKHFLQPNLGLALMKQFFQQIHYNHVLITNEMVDERTLYSNRGGTYLFPLYLYSKDGIKTPNLEKEIVAKIEKSVGKVSPEDILAYIYAILNSPHYREKYDEFLKIDFPRLPFPRDTKSFKRLVELGQELCKLHLFQSPKTTRFITSYKEEGQNIVEKHIYKDNRVYINEKQYFGKVPEVAWSFYIGGYQPAQKWLKDRKGYILTNEDIEHYQKIIVSLVETDKIMKEITKVQYD